MASEEEALVAAGGQVGEHGGHRGSREGRELDDDIASGGENINLATGVADSEVLAEAVEILVREHDGNGGGGLQPRRCDELEPLGPGGLVLGHGYAGGVLAARAPGRRWR